MVKNVDVDWLSCNIALYIAFLFSVPYTISQYSVTSADLLK